MKNGKELVSFAKSKVGTPYFYGAKMQKLTEAFMKEMHRLYPYTVTEGYMNTARAKGIVGKVCVDCSGLIYAYTGKNLGSSQLYQQAYKRLSTKDYKDWADGVVVWRKGHVGVFYHDGNKCYVIEAKGISYGTVVTQFKPTNWSYGLTFSWLKYDYARPADGSYKAENPFKEPLNLIRYGSIGTGVKWVQFELVEAGYDLAIDGDFGNKTKKAVIDFQKSCKITPDGIVGNITRQFLKAR